MTDDSESVLIKLTRMEGKLDLSNMRHDQHDARFSAIENRFNSHGERLTGLEGREIGRDGERKGVTTSTKIIWAGFIGLAGVLIGVLTLLVRVFQ